MSYYALVLQTEIDANAANPSVNLFTYLTTEVAPTQAGADALASAFENQHCTSGATLIDVLHTNTTFVAVTVTAPTVPTVLKVLPLTGGGAATGDAMPRFVAFEFNCSRTVANIRPGKKRFGAISEGMVTNGALNPTFATLLDDMATALGDVLSATVGGVGVNFTPIIVKRIPYTTPAGNTAYRLPEGLDPFAYSLATNWNYQSVTTQNSRKR